jgi:hypothetical protein
LDLKDVEVEMHEKSKDGHEGDELLNHSPASHYLEVLWDYFVGRRD